MPTIAGSVGRGGLNAPGDVQTVRVLLNNFSSLTGGALLPISGASGPELIEAIQLFQARVAKLSDADGRVDPNGRTWSVLATSTAPTVTTASSSPSQKVVKACEAEWDRFKHDCSGFLRAVASDLGIKLDGLANALIDTMSGSPWRQLGNDAKQASELAGEGLFVVAGLKADPHGHVAVIVPGSVRGYPIGYWGQLGGTGRKNTSINYSWTHADLLKVQYFARAIPDG